MHSQPPERPPRSAMAEEEAAVGSTTGCCDGVAYASYGLRSMIA